MDELWVEKYRPKKFDDMVGQNDIVEEIRENLSNLPHLLFYGPAGVGKTTMAYIIGRELFGENFRSNFMELNASDERGIQVIREKVKNFAKVQPLNADFKVIFLDEADYLTADAQASLRRVMEVYHKTTRFILSCNYSHKVIPAIKSRCKCYGFNKLDDKDIKELLVSIAPSELGVEVIDGIVKDCNGDMRSAINELQGLKAVKGARLKENKDYIINLIEFIKQGDFLKGRGLVDVMLKEGWDERRMLVEVRDKLVASLFDKKFISSSLLSLLRADVMLVDGVDRVLVFDGLLLSMVKGDSL